MPRRRYHPEAGLSLIEVMVVVFIIGLAASLVALTLPSQASAEERAAQKFLQTLKTAQDQAVITGEPIGIVISEQSYSLQVWRRGQWRDIGRDEVLTRRLNLSLRQERGDKQLADWPSLILDPTGVTDGAIFDLMGPEEELAIQLLPTGAMQIDAL